MFDYYRLRKHKVYKFNAKVEIDLTVGSYQLKTVTDSEELIEALRLRYQIFHREFVGKAKPSGIDVDEFDFDCDHLVIRDLKSRRIVGTYRLNCSLFSSKFYSQNEFEIGKILALPGVKTELGRACIDKEHRRGIVISLLWKGIALYMAKTQSQYMFGCASVRTQSPRQAALLYRYFEDQKCYHEDFFCPPQIDYSMPALDLWIQTMRRELTPEEISEAKALVPSLCQAYLKVGAFLGGEPAYDSEYQCIDFLTILQKEKLNKSLWQKHTAPSIAAPSPQISVS